jgi:methylphosphotriester-DNA--protein-cysteine methyltransferase
LNYYLPTTDKLLKNYISIIEKGIESRSLSATLHELSESLDTINTAFEKILEMLYVEQETDILSDIETLETMMRNEGLISSGD